MAKLKLLDTHFQHPGNYKFILDGKVRSPWYDEQEARAATKQELAQEVDIDYAASGFQYFDPNLIAKWKEAYARQPLHVGEIMLSPDWRNPEWTDCRGGAVELWFNPQTDGSVPKSWTDIACGVDTATGQAGEESSNSVASFVRASTGEKIAQYTTNCVFPSDFALSVLALCHWMNDALLCPERNGPGGIFLKQVADQRYANVFRMRKDEIRNSGKRLQDMGVWTENKLKKILFSEYRKALMEGKFINRSERALDELAAYVWDSVRIEHSRSLATTDPTATGENHGDMAVADVLAWRAAQDICGTDEKPVEIGPPIGSALWRRKQWERGRRGKRAWG